MEKLLESEATAKDVKKEAAWALPIDLKGCLQGAAFPQLWIYPQGIKGRLEQREDALMRINSTVPL